MRPMVRSMIRRGDAIGNGRGWDEGLVGWEGRKEGEERKGEVVRFLKLGWCEVESKMEGVWGPKEERPVL